LFVGLTEPPLFAGRLATSVPPGPPLLAKLVGPPLLARRLAIFVLPEPFVRPGPSVRLRPFVRPKPSIRPRYQLAGGRKFLAVGTLSGAPTLLTVGIDHM